jgi:hypothetical protein
MRILEESDMGFIRLDENITVNSQYIIKVKWKLNPENDELSASVFLGGSDKNEVIAIKGEPAYKLWDALHEKEQPPRSKFDEARVELERTRRGW